MSRIMRQTRKKDRVPPLIRSLAFVVMILGLIGIAYLQMAQDYHAMVEQQTEVAISQTQLASKMAAEASKQHPLEVANRALAGPAVALLDADGRSLTGGTAPKWAKGISMGSSPLAQLVDGQGRSASLWSTLLGGTHRVIAVSSPRYDAQGKAVYLATGMDVTAAVRSFRHGVLARTGLFVAAILFCLLVVLTCAPELLARRTARAETDPMTGLPNAHAFNARLEEEMERSNRYEHPLSLMIIEIDYLMTLVDTQGPVLADRVLRDIAELLRTSFRLVDVLSYRGEGQFVALLPETNLRGGMTAAERLRAKIEKTPFNAPHGAKLRLTASIGLTAAPPEAASADSLLTSAEHALTSAKQAGRNQVSCFNDPVAA